MTSIELPLVSFRHTYSFPDGTEVSSDSTIRFRSREEVDVLLRRAGSCVLDLREVPDRPGRKYVFVAQQPR